MRCWRIFTDRGEITNWIKEYDTAEYARTHQERDEKINTIANREKEDAPINCDDLAAIIADIRTKKLRGNIKEG